MEQEHNKLTREIIGLVCKGIGIFSEKYNTFPKNIRLGIYSQDENGTPGYRIFKESSFQQIRFNDLLGVRIDPLMREYIAAPYIHSFILRASVDFDVPLNNLNLLLATQAESIKELQEPYIKATSEDGKKVYRMKDNILAAFVFNGSTQVARIDMNYIMQKPETEDEQDEEQTEQNTEQNE